MAESMRRRKGDEYEPVCMAQMREDLLYQCAQQTIRFGGGGVIMWRCISSDRVEKLY